MTTSTSQASALPQAVRQAQRQILALLAEADPKAAEWVNQLRSARPPRPTVVVVGETNRGKSSLVNTLLATPGLSPVDADVATSTYLVFGHHEHWRAQACYPGQLAPVPFDIAELPNWTSAQRELPPGQLPPRHVEVDGPVPLLERLTIVDTPGVGGLNSMHGELAKEAAATATALLFVMDASSPLTAGELGFLAEVGDRTETVVFALTKTDAFRGWREVLEANRQLLATHAPRFADAPFHPCSARLAELAATVPAEQSALLRCRSGITELQTTLRELLVGRSVMLAEANTLRALSTALAELHTSLSAKSRALSDGEDEAKALRSRRDELTNLRRSATRGWQLKLRGEVQRARMETGHEVSREMREVQAWFRRAIDQADRNALRELPGQVDAALRLVSGRLSNTINQRLSRVTATSLSELFSPADLQMIHAQVIRGERPPLTVRPLERRPPTAEDRLLIYTGVTGGVSLARTVTSTVTSLSATLATAALGSIIMLPVSAVIGLGAGWWLARTRRHTSEKQHMKQWLVEAIADARGALDQLVSEQLIEAEQQLSLALDDALGRRIDAIEAELREVDKTMKLAQSERTKQLSAVTRELSKVSAAEERVEQLLGSIRALRDRPIARPDAN